VPTTEEIAALLQRFDEVAKHLTWTLLDCAEADLKTPLAEGEWSPLQILAHIRGVDDMLTVRIATLLTSNNPALPRLDFDAWATVAGYAEAPLDQTLHAWQRHRSETIWQLNRLPLEAWNRTAIHPSRGNITLLDLVQRALEHEEEHSVELDAAFEDEVESVEGKE